MAFCIVVIHLSLLKAINLVKRGNSCLANRCSRLLDPLDNSQDCLILCTLGLNRAVLQSFLWSKVKRKQSAEWCLQNKSTLKPTLLLLVIVSKTVSSRNKSRPSRISQKKFIGLFPVHPFICEGKNLFLHQSMREKNRRLFSLFKALL